MESGAHVLSRVAGGPNESSRSAGESVLDILKLIFAGSPLHEVLTIIARLVESQGDGLPSGSRMKTESTFIAPRHPVCRGLARTLGVRRWVRKAHLAAPLSTARSRYT
jgi:hypothetical protein